MSDIKHIEHQHLNKKKWDQCISASVNGNICALSWYLDITSPGWEALVKGEYEAVFPLTWRKKSMIKYLYQPAFTQQLGLFTPELLTEELVNQFIEAIPEEFRLAEINLNTLNKVSLSWVEVNHMTNYLLDLIPSYHDLRQQYSTNLKRNLKKFAATQLKVIPFQDSELLIELFRETRGKKIKTLQDRDYLMLKQLIKEATKRKNGQMLGVFNQEDRLIAGAFFATWKSRSVFLFSASHEEGRKSGAMSAIIDTVIAEYSGLAHILDFEGSNDFQLARFYRSFGSKETQYPFIKIDRLPAVSKNLISILKKIRNKK